MKLKAYQLYENIRSGQLVKIYGFVRDYRTNIMNVLFMDNNSNKLFVLEANDFKRSFKIIESSEIDIEYDSYFDIF